MEIAMYDDTDEFPISDASDDSDDGTIESGPYPTDSDGDGSVDDPE